MTDEDQLGLILTEYEQAGEEYRTRHQLLHNSYYLFVIFLSVFGGAAINVLDDPLKLGLICLLGGIASFVLGFAILTHYVERQSAGVLRTRAERAIEDIRNEEIDHNLNIQRPISIQYYLVGQNVKIDESGELALRDGDFSVVWTIPDFSAKGLGQGVLFLSIVQALAGVYLLGNVAHL